MTSDRRLHRVGIGAGRRGQRIHVVRGEQLHLLVEDARRQPGGRIGGQGAQLRREAFAGIGRGHARPVAVQQADAQQADVAGAVREGGARGGEQFVERPFEVAAVVAVVQPPGRDFQVGGVPVQRQLAQQAQARVA